MTSPAILLTLCLVFSSLTSAATPQQENMLIVPFKNILLRFLGRSGTVSGLRRAARFNKVQSPVEESTPFPCDLSQPRSPQPPTSVNQLRPGDIDVIAAMGDSLTAGNGAAASNLLHVLQENRGISWSIGGQSSWREYLTLPNIMKAFNPDLMGYSLSDSWTHHRNSQFNVAEPGSMSRDMPYMAKILVKRIRADPRVDIHNHWKLVTLMIGGNDYCVDICYLSDKDMNNSHEKHRKDLLAALDYLRDNLPRTLVNVVISPNVRLIKEFNGKSNVCTVLHLMECPCLFGRARQSRVKDVIRMVKEWQRVEEEVGLDERYLGRDDFAVVIQPFTADIVFPQRETPRGNITDYSFLSEDCFHFSQKGYARAANAIWNNMMEPVGQKSKDWTDTFQRFLCPTEEHPYIYTMKNSWGDVSNRIIS